MHKNNTTISWLNIGSSTRGTIILWEIIEKIKHEHPSARIFLKNLKLINNQDVVDFNKKDIFIQLNNEFEYKKDFDFIALEMVRTLKLKIANKKIATELTACNTDKDNLIIGSMLSFLEKYTLISFELGILAESEQAKLEDIASEVIKKLSIFSEDNVRSFTETKKIDAFYESIEMIDEGKPKKIWEKFISFGESFDLDRSSGEDPVELAILLLGFSLYFHKENAEKIYWILDRFEKAYYEIYSSSHKDIPNVSNYIFLLIGDVKYYLFKFI